MEILYLAFTVLHTGPVIEFLVSSSCISEKCSYWEICTTNNCKGSFVLQCQFCNAIILSFTSIFSCLGIFSPVQRRWKRLWLEKRSPYSLSQRDEE